MIDPGIKEDPDYWVYKQMVEGEHYCKEETGKIFIGKYYTLAYMVIYSLS